MPNQSRVPSTKSRKFRIGIVFAMIASLPLSERQLSLVFAEEGPCYKVAAGLVAPSACAPLEITTNWDSTMIICNSCSGHTNAAIAYLKCSSVGPEDGGGQTVCNDIDQNVGLQNRCIIDYDYDGIALALAGLAATTYGCLIAIAERSPRSMAACLAALALSGMGLEPCLYKICAGDPWATTPIRRRVFQSLSGDSCDP